MEGGVHTQMEWRTMTKSKLRNRNPRVNLKAQWSWPYLPSLSLHITLLLGYNFSSILLLYPSHHFFSQMLTLLFFLCALRQVNSLLLVLLLFYHRHPFIYLSNILSGLCFLVTSWVFVYIFCHMLFLRWSLFWWRKGCSISF